MTQAQTAAIEAPEPFCLVSAGPGSGKSTVLLSRALHLVMAGTPASRIVLLTFTNSAAKVLTDRLADKGATLQFVGTLHSFLLRLLTAHGQVIGLKQPISVIDEEEQLELLKEALEDTAYRGTLRNVQAEVAKGPAPRLNPMSRAELAAEAFFQRLRADGILTYDCILFHGERLLKAMKAKGLPLPIDHLLVDEAQDLTEQDWRIIEATGVPNIWVCGDFDQAIFQWRSGEKNNWFETACRKLSERLS